MNILRWLCDLGAVDESGVFDAVGHVRRPSSLDDWLIEGRVADSVLETTMNRLLRQDRLPPARFHAVLHGYEVDFWIVDTPIVLECDGWGIHGLDHRQFERDRDRDSDLTGLCYITVRFTYRRLVTEPRWVVERIRRALARWAAC